MPTATSANDSAAPQTLPQRTVLWMLLALIGAFNMSQAFRTVGAIMAPPLQSDFALSPDQLGVFSGAFHFAFGAMQLFMGIGIDLYGVRRTILAAFPLAILGAVVSALAPGYLPLTLAQVLIGLGCAPAFLVCTVFIARHFPPQRFAAISGMALAVGTFGMLLTGTPLAWIVERWSWRAGFWVLALLAALAWLWIWRTVFEPARYGTAPTGQRESVPEALRRFAALFTLPHTWGIVVLGSTTYAALITLRGLWMGPMLIERHGYTLVQGGNAAVLLSLVALVGPVLFGRFDPGPATRRRWLTIWTLALAALFALLAFGFAAWLDVALMLAIGLVSGFIVLQYADVRIAYPMAITGRAMAAFTMAMFMGVAVMQWATGVIATLAKAAGGDPYEVVMGSIAAWLALSAIGFALLPQPPKS
ncbi:MAG: MFS transporter [Comamonas sp.]|jgi:predicted MFS family arabinose efflux permease|nr:MFS transporter [Comamonas sp.]